MQPGNGRFASPTVLDDIREGVAMAPSDGQTSQLEDAESVGGQVREPPNPSGRRWDSPSPDARRSQDTLSDGRHLLKMIEDTLEKDRKQRQIERDGMKQGDLLHISKHSLHLQLW